MKLRTMSTMVVVVLMSVVTQGVLGDIVTLTPSADGYWKRSSSTTILDNNANGTLRVGREKVYSTWYKDRGLFQFDLAGVDLSLVESAVFKLTFISKYGTGTDLLLYRSTHDAWYESGTTLEGVPATTGLPVSELLGRRPSSELTTAGQVFAWDLFNGTSPYTWETIASWNPVDDAVDGSLSLVLMISNNLGEESSMSSQRYFNFHSSESVTPEFCPVLELTMVPEPATMGLMLLGATAVLRRRRAGR